MKRDYSKPDEELFRELREVARDATSLMQTLTQGPNANLPPDFPRDQLVEIAAALAQLPNGTAQGSKPTLEYARYRLPAIRRVHVVSDDLEGGVTARVGESEVVRGFTVDRNLRDLIASVTTALDEYHRFDLQHPEELQPESGIAPSGAITRDVIARSIQFSTALETAKTLVDETTEPSSVAADNLKRQLQDAAGLNRIARAELRMRSVVLSWYRLAVKAFGQLPEVIRTTAQGLRKGSDIALLGWERWHEFKGNGVKHLIEEFQKTCDMFVAVADKLEGGKSNSTKSQEEIGEFDNSKARAMIILGNTMPASWIPNVTGIAFKNRESVGKGLSQLVFLQDLDLSGAQVDEFGFLSQLNELSRLDLQGTKITDLAPLSSLTKLVRLYLAGTRIADLTPLEGLNRLQRLDLSGTDVRDLSPLSGLKNLVGLDISNTAVSDLRPLAGLVKLEWLHIHKTLVTDLTPVLDVERIFVTEDRELSTFDRDQIRKRKKGG